MFAQYVPVFNLQYYIQWIFSLMFRLEICDVQFPDEIQNVGIFIVLLVVCLMSLQL